MDKTLLRYKIGLGVLGIFIIVVLVLLLSKAGDTKQDAKTTKVASSIADKLNAYTDYSSIPDNLTAAGITGVPATVTYQKLSSEKYLFCVTYKAASSGFDSSSVLQTVLTRGMSGSSYGYNSTTGSQDATYLYIDSTHPKGRSCQTIKPYNYQTSNYDNTITDYSQ